MDAGLLGGRNYAYWAVGRQKLWILGGLEAETLNAGGWEAETMDAG